MEQTYTEDERRALEMDAHDPLSWVRERFYLQPGTIYVDGNSLGLLSRDAEGSLLRVLDEWKTMGIKGWMHAQRPWFTYAEELAALQAPLVGAEADEVILHASTTVNIHALMASFLSPETSRSKVLMDELTFPSDRYAIESQLRLRGLDPATHLVLVRSRDGRTIAEADVVEAMTKDIAIAFLPSVLYRSGQLLDMAALTAEAHRRDILIGFDCAHSVGAVPHQLSAWGVDCACWCTYKYCNSGPGGVAGLYVNRRHLRRGPGLAGWFGYRKDRQFDLRDAFEPAHSAGAWQIGTPHLLSLAPLEGSLRLFEQVGIQAVRKKSLQLTAYLMELIDQRLAEHGFSVGTPREPTRRGGHVALEHQDAVQINQALKDRGILPDYRPPNIIRLAPVALYTSFHEAYQVIQTIHEIVETRAYRQYGRERGIVA